MCRSWHSPKEMFIYSPFQICCFKTLKLGKSIRARLLGFLLDEFETMNTFQWRRLLCSRKLFLHGNIRRKVMQIFLNLFKFWKLIEDEKNKAMIILSLSSIIEKWIVHTVKTLSVWKNTKLHVDLSHLVLFCMIIRIQSSTQKQFWNFTMNSYRWHL